jgi:hypothetical protein
MQRLLANVKDYACSIVYLHLCIYLLLFVKITFIFLCVVSLTIVILLSYRHYQVVQAAGYDRLRQVP